MAIKYFRCWSTSHDSNTSLPLLPTHSPRYTGAHTSQPPPQNILNTQAHIHTDFQGSCPMQRAAWGPSPFHPTPSMPLVMLPDFTQCQLLRLPPSGLIISVGQRSPPWLFLASSTALGIDSCHLPRNNGGDWWQLSPESLTFIFSGFSGPSAAGVSLW